MLQHLSLFMQSAGALLEGNLWLLIGIAAAACVLGVEVAGIGILLRKVHRAKKEKLKREEEERNSFYGAALMGAATVPFSAEAVLAILLGLSAVAAIVFTVLLIVFRSNGYDYISSKARSEAERFADAAVQAEEPAELPIEKPVEDTVTEEEVQIPEAVEAEKTAEETIAEDAEAAEQYDGTEAVTDSEEIDFTAPEVEDNGEATPEEEAVPAFAEAEAGGMETVKETAGADSKDPVRIVTIEKTTRVKTETTKEFADAPEAKSAAPSGASSDQTERLIQMIGTLAEKIDKVHLEAVAQAPENVTVLAEDEPLPRDEDEDEDDDLTADEATDGDEDEGADPEDSERFTGTERIIGYDETTGCYIVAHYRKSFLAKMIQSKPTIKHYYSEMKNALLAYKGTKSRTSWAADSFHNGRTAIAKINVKTNILELYLALEPETLEGTVYKGKDVGHLKRYADTPFKYRVKSPRKFKWAMELIQRVCEEKGLSPIDIEPVDYEAENPFAETDALVARGLIKEYIRQQKAANTFELDDSHVPHVVDMDETVIPTSANVLWEFDNELLAQKQEEELPLPELDEAEEESPAEEPVEMPAEEVGEPERTVAREKVVTETTEEVTHVRYTERYFASEAEAEQYHPLGEEVLRGEFTVPGEEDAEVTETEEYREEEIEGTEDSPEDVEELYEDAEETVNEESLEEEIPEEESELVSAFEAEATDPEDDLDWGIPEELLEQTSVMIQPEEPAEEALAAEDEGLDSGETEAPVEETDEAVAEDEYGYGEEALDEAEEADEMPEEETDGESLAEESEEEWQEEAAELTESEEDAEGYYDEEGNYFLNDENADGYYDKDGNYILFDENATGYYDKDGNYILYDENATGYYDPNGNYIFYDENATGYYDPDGNYVLYDTEAETDDGVYEDSTEALYAEEDSHEGYYTAEGEFVANETEPQEPEAAQPTRTANPDVALVDLAVLEANFPNGSEIDLNALKAMGLVMQSAKFLKIYCSGEITKSLTVIADQFTMEAIAAINGAGGDAQMIKNKGGEN